MKQDQSYDQLIELTVKKLSGEASDAELQALEDLLTTEEKKSEYDCFVNAWEKSANAKGILNEDIDQEWNRLNTAIQNEKSSSGFNYMKIAATITILIVAGLTAYFFWNEDEVQIIATEITELPLADGSTITLMKGSKLAYPEKFEAGIRKVKLKGEAYFEVSKDESKPFQVITEKMKVEVLGTKFNVVTGEQPEVILTEGKVRVNALGQEVVLDPGQRATLSNEKLMKSINSNSNYQSWRTKVFTFENSTLQEVVKQLNKAYQRNLELGSQHLNNCPITVNFDNETFEDILQILSSTLDLKVNVSGDKLILDGEGC
mgnify:CR=1 FL=1